MGEREKASSSLIVGSKDNKDNKDRNESVEEQERGNQRLKRKREKEREKTLLSSTDGEGGRRQIRLK